MIDKLFTLLTELIKLFGKLLDKLDFKNKWHLLGLVVIIVVIVVGAVIIVLAVIDHSPNDDNADRSRVYAYEFEAGFWSVEGPHEYTLSVNCPPSLLGQLRLIQPFMVSSAAQLRTRPLYFSYNGIRDDVVDGQKVAEPIHPSQLTIAAVRLAKRTRSFLDRVQEECAMSISWDGGLPHPLQAGPIESNPFE